MNLFDSMRSFAQKPRTVRLAAPEDVLQEIKHWSPEQLLLPESERGAPVRVEMQTRPGAATMDFQIRPLSMLERSLAEAIPDAAQPPPIYTDEPAERPGMPPRRVANGYDFDHPEYLAALRPLHDRQAAYVALKGVIGLEQDTPGVDENAKLQAIMESMPTRMIRFLSNEIWNMTYIQGAPEDFFTNEDSPASPSSEPSPKPSQGDRKRK